MSKYAGFLVLFRILFNFNSILAQKRTLVRYLRSFRFFWHPWHPWGRLSSGDIWVLRFVLNILLQWRHLAEIFIFIKMIDHVSFIILVHQIGILSLIISIKLTMAQFIYDGIFSHCPKKSHWSNGENIWGKLMVFFPIRSIYLDDTN